MPGLPDDPPTQLNDVLSHALDRAVGTSLDSLHTLRRAVREYTQRQKERGVPLDTIMLALSSVLMEVEDERLDGDGSDIGGIADGARDPELARQLRAWCSKDYS
jgi:hypothetical protein